MKAWFGQKWRELRDCHKVAEVHMPKSWHWIFGLPYLDINLDQGFDWTWVLLCWDIGPFYFRLGFVDND